MSGPALSSPLRASSHTSRGANPERPTGWREKLAVLGSLPKLLALVWRTHRGYTIAMVALRIVRGLVPVAMLWVGKLIIDAAIHATHGGSMGVLWRSLAMEAGIVLAGEFLARASALVESLLGDLFSNDVSVRLMRHAATLDLAQFEDPTFYDHLERARQQTTGRIGLIAELLGMGQDAETLTTLAVALVAYNPWLLLLLAAAVFPSFVGETHYAALGYSLLFRRTPERRELDYLRYTGASDETAKEVQMFGLAPWLTQRYHDLADRYYRGEQAAVRPTQLGQWPVVRAGNGRILRGVRRDPASGRRRGDHDRPADVFRRLVHAEPRSDSAAFARGQRHLRAEPQPQGPVRFFRDPTDHLDAGRRCRRASTDSRGIHLRARRVSVSRK